MGRRREEAWEGGRLSEGGRRGAAVLTRGVLVGDLPCLELSSSLREEKIFEGRWGKNSKSLRSINYIPLTSPLPKSSPSFSKHRSNPFLL